MQKNNNKKEIQPVPQRLLETVFPQGMDMEFYIDRTFGFPIWIPVDEKGIIQPFWDNEYNGKLSERVAGKPLSLLHKTLKSLYKTWLKSHTIYESLNKYDVVNLRDAVKDIEKYRKEIKIHGYEKWKEKNYNYGDKSLKEVETHWKNVVKKYNEAEKKHQENLIEFQKKYNTDFKFFYH